jgi:hypothetical protein
MTAPGKRCQPGGREFSTAAARGPYTSRRCMKVTGEPDRNTFRAVFVPHPPASRWRPTGLANRACRSASEEPSAYRAAHAACCERMGPEFSALCKSASRSPSNVCRFDQASCVQPDFAAALDHPMCAQLDNNGFSDMVTAHCLIATCRKLRFGAHRLIVPGTARATAVRPARLQASAHNPVHS